MKVFLTGATGYLGTPIAEALVRAGHDVVALARSDDAEKRLAGLGLGVTAARGDVRDAARVAALAAEADATIHAANTQSPENTAADEAVARAVLAAYRETGKTFVYTSGAWSFGDTGDAVATERSPTRTPLPLVAWRVPVERDVVASERDGVRGVVIRPAIAYGRAGGIPSMLVAEARAKGGVRVIGDGRQEWPTVHVDDLAALYARALHAPAGSILHGADGQARARDVAIAASHAGGAAGRTLPWTREEAEAELGGFGAFFAIHQRLDAAETRRLTGWKPAARSIVEDLLLGSYARRGPARAP